MPAKVRTLELLSPARDAETAIAAINHGADAVYIGAPAFGARAAATNSVDDIARVAEYAHQFGVRVYVTLNTIIYEHELDDVRRLIAQLYEAGVDALIVQDMAVLTLDIPPIDLHASTQTDARSPEKIARMAAAGFSQIVAPREFSLDQIRQAALAAGDASIEVFVHGALCVSYSGDCHAGAILTGRSANRGECPQICRLRFRLTDAEGRDVATPDGGPTERHWLSLADMNRLDSLAELIDAGASSFKIEGRLKPLAYVKNVTAAYSRALDSLAEASDGALRRSSYGRVELGFTPDVTRAFNRGFTPYFLTPAASTGITSWRSPKWTGLPVATVVKSRPGMIEADVTTPLSNGDGLGYFGPNGQFVGFRLNRSEGSRLYPAPGTTVLPPAGTILYRNSDSALESRMQRSDTARRSIGLRMALRHLPDGRIALDIDDERGCSISVCSELKFTDTARSPQEQHRRDTLARLGDTIYRLDSLADSLGPIFLPAKALTALRRQGLDALDRAWHIQYRRRLRRKSTLAADALSGVTTSYHDNVANTAAERFYTTHGADIGARAAEVDEPHGEVRVMTTRYCLRRELGACLRSDNADKLPRQLFLEAPAGRLRLDFDCNNCQMKILTKHK